MLEITPIKVITLLLVSQKLRIIEIIIPDKIEASPADLLGFFSKMEANSIVIIDGAQIEYTYSNPSSTDST